MSAAYNPPEAARDASVLELVYPRFEEHAGEPLLDDTVAQTLVEVAAMHADLVADLTGEAPASAAVVADRVARALAHLHGFAGESA